MSSEDVLPKLLPLIYEAAVNSDVWPELLAEIGAAFEATASTLAEYDFAARSGRHLQAHGIDPRSVVVYADRYAHKNVWLRSQASYRHKDSVHLGQDLVPSDDLVRSEFYTDYLQPQNVFHRLCGVLDREGPIVRYLALLRPRAAPAFGRDEVARLRALLPHLRRGLAIHQQVAKLREERDAALAGLDYLPIGVVLVDGAGVPLAANRSAADMLRADDNLSACPSIPRAGGPCNGEALRKLIGASACALTGASMDAGRALEFTSPFGSRSLKALVSPLSPSSDFLKQGNGAIVFIQDPETPPVVSDEKLRWLHGLTRMEARVAALLAGGWSVEDAANALRVSRHTARGYLKQIFVKTGVSRQAELVALLLLGPAHLRDGERRLA